MPLVQSYASDDDDAPISPMEDAFGVSSIPVAKRPRIEGDAVAVTTVQTSAPDVLAEVRV